jgi:hypothetical protein
VLSLQPQSQNNNSTLSVCHCTAKANAITHAPTLRVLQAGKKKPSFSLSRCLVHRTLSCTMFPSGPLVPSYFLAFLPSLDKIFFSGSLFHNCHGSSKSHTRRKRIPHHHRHRRLVTYLDRTSYICKTCHVLVLLRACRHKEQR